MLPSDLYDSICRYAMEHDVSVSRLIRSYVQAVPDLQKYIAILLRTRQINIEMQHVSGEYIELVIGLLQSIQVINHDSDDARVFQFAMETLEQALETIKGFTSIHQLPLTETTHH